MGKFQITDHDSGRTVVVSGDSAPTEQEAHEIFAAHAADANVKQDAVAAEIQGNIAGRQNMLQRAGQNISYNPMTDPNRDLASKAGAAAMQIPTVAAEGFVGANQAVENTAARAVGSDILKRRGVNLSPGDQVEMGDVYRAAGLGPNAAQLAGLFTMAAPGMFTGAMQAGKAVGAAAGKVGQLAADSGLGLVGWAQRLGNIPEAAIKKLKDLKYDIPETMFKHDSTHVNDLAQEMIDHVDLMKKARNVLWENFDSKQVLTPEESKAVGSVIGKHLNGESNVVGRQEVQDLPMGQRTLETTRNPTGRTSTTERSSVVSKYSPLKDEDGNMVPGEGPYAATGLTSKKISKAQTVADSGMSVGKGQTIEAAKEMPFVEKTTQTTSKKTTNVKPTTKAATKPYNMIDFYADAVSGRTVTAGQVKTAMDQLNASGNPMAMRMAADIQSKLKGISPTYDLAHEVSGHVSNAETASEMLMGGKSGLYNKATGQQYAANPGSLLNYYRSSPGGAVENAPKIIDNAVNKVLGYDPEFTSRTQLTSAAGQASNAKTGLTTMSHAGLEGVVAAKSGVHPGAVAAAQAVTYALGKPKFAYRAGQMIAGTHPLQKAWSKSRVAAVLNSPAAKFLNTSAVGQAALNKMRGSVTQDEQQPQ